ncbi:MAG: phosphogluconate dehydratase [Paracoccaceae bacterium]|nr:phosphogluconate dehydratase [Paracoccaceae bacterium]
MPINEVVSEVTNRIILRSRDSRLKYLENMQNQLNIGPRRAHLTCGNQAHAYASTSKDKISLSKTSNGNIGIVTAYNDMLSAHQPFESYPELIRKTAREFGGTAQVAGGVPAMCDGVTQGQPGMELSLFSRDVIALAASIALSHNTFDTSIYLGVCDKIVPGLVISAATFGFLPAVFAPAGPMPSGIPNDKKSIVRQKFATGEISREELMKAEMASYHSPGTCTFYGTANSNQMLMEFMGLHLPGSSFVPPNTPLRTALTKLATRRALEITSLGKCFTPAYQILDEKAFVNGIVGLMATGGSTNLVLHLPAMAKAAGIKIELSDFDDISSVTPLMAKIYPNGLADVNHFHAAGGLNYMISQLLEYGYLHNDVQTIMGSGLETYTKEPKLVDGKIEYVPSSIKTHNEKILRPVIDPFQKSGGIKKLDGNLGTCIIKISSVPMEKQIIEAPARVFESQEDVKNAFKKNELDSDSIIVVRFQGPIANGMPELHGLTPILSVLQDRGIKVALITDGRMSGASGKVPAAIHLSPEASSSGPISKIKNGDLIRLDALSGELNNLEKNFESREVRKKDLTKNESGLGRELFKVFRENAKSAKYGGGIT